jgi:hypothetical protein
MKFKLFAPKRRINQPPKLTVQRHIPWPLRVLGWTLAVLLGAGTAIAVWNATIGKGAKQREQLVADNKLQDEQLISLEAERKRLQSLVDVADSKLKIEKTAQENLAKQLSSTEAENAKLKVDLAYMESLLPSAQVGDGLAVRRFQVEKDSVQNQWLLKGLLVQADKSEKEFSGTLQVIASGTQNGKPFTWTWPEAGKAETLVKSKVSFKRTLRISQTLNTPADMVVKSMQIRVLEQGSIRAQQSVNVQ